MLDGAVDLLVLTFSVMLENDLTMLVYDVLRRPIPVAVSIPCFGVVVLGYGVGDAMTLQRGLDCQSALDWDPVSASKRDPFERRVRPVALAPSELAGVAETVRARVV